MEPGKSPCFVEEPPTYRQCGDNVIVTHDGVGSVAMSLVQFRQAMFNGMRLIEQIDRDRAFAALAEVVPLRTGR